MPEAQRAQCQHCRHHYVKKNLMRAPDGGAICKDWFKCQQRADKRATERGGLMRSGAVRRIS